jgi:hypothetical protein
MSPRRPTRPREHFEGARRPLHGWTTSGHGRAWRTDYDRPESVLAPLRRTSGRPMPTTGSQGSRKRSTIRRSMTTAYREDAHRSLHVAGRLATHLAPPRGVSARESARTASSRPRALSTSRLAQRPLQPLSGGSVPAVSPSGGSCKARPWRARRDKGLGRTRQVRRVRCTRTQPLLQP